MSWSVGINKPEKMYPLLKEKTIENIFFKKTLRTISSRQFDEWVRQYASIIEPQINCLECANCCKKLEPGIDLKELETLADKKQLTINQFKQQYIAFDGDTYYLNTKPCIFLNGNACGIYHQRPSACQEYPHLNKSDLKHRYTFWDNYTKCPIVFNIIEAIKAKMNFAQ
jgi:uncharacterized protein